MSVQEYFSKDIDRSRRRKSPWNFVFIPLVIICGTGIFLLFWNAIQHLQNEAIPPKVIFFGYTRLGRLLMIAPFIFLSLPLGMLCANFITRMIPAARTAFEEEAKGFKHTSYQQSQELLLRVSIIFSLIALPVSMWGATNYFYVTDKGIVSHSFFSKKEYAWGDVKDVFIACDLRFYKSFLLVLDYELTFQDGARVDLWQSGYSRFLDAYEKIYTLLRQNRTASYSTFITACGLKYLDGYPESFRTKVKFILHRQ